MYYRGFGRGVKPGELLHVALELAERYGWSLIPIRNLEDGKRPVVRWKPFQTYRASQTTLQKLFSIKGVTGVGVVHGEVSNGLAIRDFDDAKAYHAWAEKHPKLARSLPTAKTARGFHVYHRGPSLFVSMDDGEYRGTVKQYTLVPPSLHPSGIRYAWLYRPGRAIPLVDDPVDVGLCIPNKSKISTKYISKSTPPPTIPHGFSGRIPLSIDKVVRPTDPLVHILVKKNMPTWVGQRHKRIFALAQDLKGLDQKWTPEELEGVFWEWWKLARTIVRTKEKDLSYGEFLEAYALCRHPGGMDWSLILQQAKKIPIPKAAQRYTKRGQMLVRICACLQERNGKKPFFLSSRTASDLIGFSIESAQLAFRYMRREGLLQLVEQGCRRTGRASSYYYLGGPA